MDPKAERRAYLQDKINELSDSYSGMIDKMVDMTDEEIAAEAALPEAERTAKVAAWNTGSYSISERIKQLEAELKALDKESD